MAKRGVRRARNDGGPRLRGDGGAALVELAITMPIVIAVVLATVSSGMAIHQRTQLDHAAREGARYGATLPSSQTFANEGTWAENVASVVDSRAHGELSVPGATLCVSLVEGSGSGGVHVVSGPYARSTYTTNPTGLPCDPAETYPTTLYDLGRRVQVRATRPASIESGLKAWSFTLRSDLSVKSESSG